MACAVAAGLGGPLACGQAFNIDLGPSGHATPSQLHGAAANQAGFWNSGFGVQRDLSGALTSVSMSGLGGTSQSFPLGDATVDDAALMEDCRSSAGVQDASLAIGGFASGEYRMFVYGWAGHLTIGYNNKFSVFDSQSGVETPIQLNFTNVWPGRQIFGETYFTYDFTVQSASDFVVVTMIYAPAGENAFPSVVNGLQIVPIPTPASALPLLGGLAIFHRRRSRSRGSRPLPRPR